MQPAHRVVRRWPLAGAAWRCGLSKHDDASVLTAASPDGATKPGFVAELLAALAVRYPTVPIAFCETRPLAEEWTYRFLGAALAHAQAEAGSLQR